MSENIYHIKIKKEYASAILEDLQQIDAIEIVGDGIPEWQKAETLRRLAIMKASPETNISREKFFEFLDKDDEEI